MTGTMTMEMVVVEIVELKMGMSAEEGPLKVKITALYLRRKS